MSSISVTKHNAKDTFGRPFCIGWGTFEPSRAADGNAIFTKRKTARMRQKSSRLPWFESVAKREYPGEV